MEAINTLFRECELHQFIFDFETIRMMLLEAGFSRVERSTYRGSAIEELNVDLDHDLRRAESLYFEAYR